MAVSGVDGSGKSSLSHELTSSLQAASVDVSHVWLRPGMGLGPLVRLATFGKRLAGQEPSPGVRAVAEERGSSLRSRRGTVGWAWVGLVTFAFVVGVRNQRRSAGPVVLHDRHVVDALATLDFAYAGVDLRHVRWLVRTFVPAVDVAFYLEVPPEVAVARKPGDVLGEFAVRRQLEAYARHLMGQGIQVLDGTTERDVIAATALETVSRTACEPKRRRRLRR
jgi:thymidylate kinase